MAIDTDQIDEVRAALDAADSLDASGIRVVVEDDSVVLRGAVATFEQSAAAQQVAHEHADAVRNELVVDHNLRETGGSEPATSEGAGENARRDGLQGSSYDPLEQTGDVVTDTQESLDENVSWDPPHESVEVPTRAEARGVADRQVGSTDTTDTVSTEGQLPDQRGSAGKSLPDLSPEELTRAARPEPAEEDNR